MELKKSPIWKQAVLDFLDAGFAPGETVSRAWLMEHFGLTEPTTVEEYRRFEVRMMNLTESFRMALLQDHCIDLRNVWGTGGYQVIPAQQQTQIAMGDARDAIQKALRTHGRRIRCVNHEALNDDQRRENADALAKFSALQHMASPKKWLASSK